MADTQSTRKILIGPFRMSFPSILKPREYRDEKTGAVSLRHELTALCPPTLPLTHADKALEEAMIAKFGADPARWPKLKRKRADAIADFAKYNSEDANKPLPGDWAGWRMIRTSSPGDRPPNVVGPVKVLNAKTGKLEFPVITDSREVYGGRWARATVEAYAYDRKDGKGLTFGLVNVQLLKHDAPFGRAAAKAEDDFDDATPEMAGGGDADWGDKPAEDDAF